MEKKLRKGSYGTGLIYAFVHFSVETLCFFMLNSGLHSVKYLWLIALLYDALAFVPQIFFGMLSDRFGKIPFGAIGCAVMTVSLFTGNIWLTLALMAFGNAMVHVEGAEMTARGASGKMGPSGIFVAGGSVGVVAGTMYAEAFQNSRWAFAVPLALMAASLAITVIMTFGYSDSGLDVKEGNVCGFDCANENVPDWAIIILSLVTVAARSYVAYAIPTGWKKMPWQTVMLFTCMAVGKGLGGVIADKAGARRTGVITLLAAIPFLVFGDRLMAVSLIGVMLFSMTMPVTFGILLSRYDDAPGFCFGITTFGLFLGTLPSFFVKPQTLTSQIIILSSLSVIAASCFFICGKNKKLERNK